MNHERQALGVRAGAKFIFVGSRLGAIANPEIDAVVADVFREYPPKTRVAL